MTHKRPSAPATPAPELAAALENQPVLAGPKRFKPAAGDGKGQTMLPNVPDRTPAARSRPSGNTMQAVSHQAETLFHRHPKNPILTAADWPYDINCVFNAGATLLHDGTTLLLCRVEDRRGHSHLCAARSKNGVDGWEIDAAPTLMPDPEHHPEELWGIEDPRITYVPELERYVVVYTSFSSSGPGVSLALTEDFRHFERYGDIMPPEDKDAALLPRRIGKYWAATASSSKRGAARGGMPTRSACRRRPSRRRKDGSSCITASAILRPAAFTAWAWLFLISRLRSVACAAAILGSSAPKRHTNATATSITSSFPVATPSPRTATRSTSTMAAPIAASPSPPAASAPY